MVATALGATVLTAVPALVAPQSAFAWECTEDLSGGDGYSDPGTAAGGGDTSGGDTSGGASIDGADISSGNVGDDLAGMSTVKITGTSDVKIYPADPEDASYTWESGGGEGGGGGGGNHSYPVRQIGPKTNRRTDCIRNGDAQPLELTQGTKYTVSYTASGNISGTVAQLLTATMGVQINTSVEKTTGFKTTINPGQSWALDVEYMTVEYAVTTTFLRESTTQFVNVLKPTGVVTSVSCQ